MNQNDMNKIVNKIKNDMNINNEIINEVKKQIENQQQRKKIDVVAIIALIVNSLMLIVTFTYVMYTYDIMKATVELNSLGIRPYVAFQNIDIQLIGDETSITGVIFGLKLKNVGNGIAKYEAKQMGLKINWNGQYENNEFKKGAYELYPNEETTYSLPQNYLTSTSMENLIGLNGSIEYTIEYYGEGRNEKYKAHRLIYFILDSLETDGRFHVSYRYEPIN